jgi:hypothetical protein
MRFVVALRPGKSTRVKIMFPRRSRGRICHA